MLAFQPPTSQSDCKQKKQVSTPDQRPDKVRNTSRLAAADNNKKRDPPTSKEEQVHVAMIVVLATVHINGSSSGHVSSLFHKHSTGCFLGLGTRKPKLGTQEASCMQSSQLRLGGYLGKRGFPVERGFLAQSLGRGQGLQKSHFQ